jgi:Pretoxin HINT domain
MASVRVASFLATASLCAAYVACATESQTSPASLSTSSGAKSMVDGKVRSAAQAENEADLAGRRQLLDEALQADEGNAEAHWQSGQVFYQGHWMTIQEAADHAGRDGLLADYREMRKSFGDGLEAQRVLARWCQKNQLASGARAHAVRLLELQPEDPEALKILGLSRYQGVLLTAEQIAQRKTHDEKAKEALRYWQPRIAEIRRQIDNKDEGQSLEGWKALRAIQDPSSIDALEAVFSKHRHDQSLEVVKVIGRMNGPAATDSLLRHALLSKWDDVRLAACEQLHGRSPVGYVPKLISALTTPTETRFEAVADNDQVTFREIVERQDTVSKQQKIVETRVPLTIPNPNLLGFVNAAAMEAFAHAQNTASVAKGSKRVERRRQELNEEVYGVLEKTTGQTLARDPDAWYTWWRQQNYMSINSKPTTTETYPQYVNVPYVPYIPPSVPIYRTGGVSISEPPPPPAPLPAGHHSCFALGTKVWTLTGPMAIENVKLGDQVLAQDALSGELTYKPVLQTTVGNSALLSIDVGSERIVATPGHLFWVSGAGWRMANNLKLGDRLHTVNGWTEVVGLEDVAAADTRNLVVADYGTYFVGDNRLLVHDVTMLQLSAGKVPGDTPSEELAAK